MEIDVKHIAKLAMLRLPEDQVEAVKEEFAAFIAMAERLPKPEQANIPSEPEDRMALREDVAVPSYPRAAMLQNASQTGRGLHCSAGQCGHL